MSAAFEGRMISIGRIDYSMLTPSLYLVLNCFRMPPSVFVNSTKTRLGVLREEQVRSLLSVAVYASPPRSFSLTKPRT